MKVLVLGSAAGPGPARRTTAAVRSALAISADGQRWVLVNALPDIGEQLRRHGALNGTQHDGAARAPICAVVLTSAAIDAALGLLSLRDGPPLDLYATPSVFEDLTSGLPLLSVLEHYCGVRWHLLGVAGEQRRATFQVNGAGSLIFEALALPGRALPYSNHRNDPSPGDHIALRVLDPATGRCLIYATGLSEVPHDALDDLHDADCLLIDGSGAPMLPELLARSRASRKVLLHLRDGEALPGGARRIEAGYDGMEIVL